MGKKKTGTHYVSKGERNNVSRKLVLACRRERGVRVEDLLKSIAFKEEVIARNEGKNKALRDKFLNEEYIMSRTLDLYSKYSNKVDKTNRPIKINFGAAKMAVMTDKVPEFENKMVALINQQNG